MTNPARRMRRNMEQSIIKASRRAISDLARQRLSEDATDFRTRLAAEEAARAEAEREKARVSDLKQKEVRKGPRAAA